MTNQMPRAKIKWNADKLVSLSAISISFITLLIFVYQTNLMRRQNYIAIMPYLMLSTTNDGESNTFEINLKNHGVGPAIIESVTLRHKGKTYRLEDYNHDFFNFLSSEVSGLDSLKNVSFSTLDIGLAIPANSSYNILAVKNDPQEHQQVREAISRLIAEGFEFEVVYRSIQDERWRIHNNSQGPERVR
ncbi:MAG: hypothetical protein KDD10_18595 [Phaeodactylibacter sp.]|nr:hypothetical protein [Phaeodactylibacter sp.]